MDTPIKPEKNLPTFTAILIIGFTSIGIGILVGIIHYFLLLKDGRSMNPAGIGLFIFFPNLLVHSAIKGGRSLAIRLTLVICSAISYAIHTVSATYMKYYTQEIDVGFRTILQETFSILSSNLFLHSFALIYPVLFFIRSSASFKPHIIQHSSLSAARKKGDSILVVATILSVLTMCLALWTSADSIDNQIEHKNILFLTVVMHSIFVFIVYQSTKRSASLAASFSVLNTKLPDSLGKFILINIVCIFMSISSLLFLSGINSYLDQSAPATLTSSLSDKFQITNNNKVDVCYRVKHWQMNSNLGSLRFCESDYGLLHEGESVELHVKAGFLGDTWISSSELIRFKNLSDFLISLKSEHDFRFANAKFFYSKNKTDPKLLSKISQWDHECHQNPGYPCRLRAYFYELEGDANTSLKLTEKGCDAHDVPSCLGLYNSNESTQEQKRKYLLLIETFCNGGHIESCTDLANALWSKGYKEHYNQIINLYQKVCSKSKTQSTCDVLDYLKRHPVK